MRMKTILLLSALAVPMLMAAQAEGGDNGGEQDPTAPATVALTSNTLSYTMPAGTFFPVDVKMPALLPPATPLTWLNTSYTFDDNGEVAAWTDGSYTWKSGSTKLSTDFDLTTSADSPYGTLGLFTSVVAAPALTEAASFYPDENGNRVDYKGTSGVEFTTPGCNMAPNFYPFDVAALTEIKPDGENPGAKEAFTYNSIDGGFSNLWSTIGDGNLSIIGFAQRVAFPGRNYIMTTVTIPDMKLPENGGSYNVVVYAAPAQGEPLGKPIKSVHVTKGNAADIFTLIESDVIIAVQDLEVDEFAPVIYGKSWIKGRELPTVNNDLFAIGATPDGSSKTLVKWNAPLEEEVSVTLDGEALPGSYYQTTVAVGINFQIGVYYPFIQPVSMIGGSAVDGNETVVVSLNSIISAASYRVISSQMPDFTTNDMGDEVPTVTVTTADGSTVPGWLRVTVNAPDAKDTDANGNIAFPDPSYETLKAEAQKDMKAAKFDGNVQSQYMVVTFALVSGEIESSTTVKITVPGNESCTFLVKANETNGVADVIASEAQVVAREYFDLSGRRLSAAPASGFFIEKVTRADGTTAATRMMR